MMTQRQLGWRKLFLILTVLHRCRSLQVSIPEAEYVVESGGDIALTCSFIPARPVTDTLNLRWEVYIDEKTKSVATFYLNKEIDIAPSYEGRAFVTVDINRQESILRLTKVTVQDNRRFQCSVSIPNDDEGTTSAITSLVVLVPPSPPVCSIQGTAEYWQNITLTCRSEEGSPPPETKWQSYSVENIARPFPPRTTEKNGALNLFNISREMSGFYICTSTNRIGSASCNLTLSVMPGSMNIGSTAAIAGAVLAGVAVLGILIYCCCCKKDKKDPNAEGSPEEEFSDRDAPEGGKPYWDDESTSETKKANQNEYKDAIPLNNQSLGMAVKKFDDDQQSYNSGRDKYEGRGSDIDSQRNQDDHRDRYRGSRDRLDEPRERYGGSRDRLDDQRDHYRGSRDRLDDQHDHYRGSRDRLDDPRDHYRGSRDRLDDPRDHYRGSRDRLNDPRDHYRGSRDRLDDPRDHYRGSRDRLDDPRDHYGGSRDRLADQSDHYRGSRDHLDYADA